MTDVVLVHVPRSAPVLPRVLLMPTGLVAIADYLDKRGYSARVLHAAAHDGDLIAELKGRGPRLLGFALSWHQQATDVMDAVARAHAALPTTPIVLGGFTASRFATEILEKFPAVSFVIHGDAERPMLELVAGRDRASIPNLVWRDEDGRVIENEARWQLDGEAARAIDFTRFDLVDNAEKVLELRMDTVGPSGDRVFYFSPGRGCGATCCYCAGARASQKKYERRDEVVTFPIDHVADQLVTIEKRGVNRWNACFDPDPTSSYYVDLFRELKKRGTTLDLIFDSFGLPTADFVDAFADTFGPGSALNVSPETGSEALRRRLRTFHYTNQQLLERLDQMARRGLRSSLYFATGLPRETRADFVDTLKLVRTIKRRHPAFWIHVGIIDIEPGSMLFDHPERLGIESPVRDFISLLDAQRAPREVNFRTTEFDEQRILDNRALIQITAECKLGGAPYEEALDESITLAQARSACAGCAHVDACYRKR